MDQVKKEIETMNPRAFYNRNVQLYKESSKCDKNYDLAKRKKDRRAIIELMCMRDND
jgi:hypothetical protein